VLSNAGANRAFAAAAILAALATSPAQPGPLFADGQHAQVRLVPGGKDAGGDLLAGVGISLDRDFKTYWRTPGESGLPPSFDFSGSTNVAHAEVLWPVPNRFEDAGGIAYGYKDQVTFPIRLVSEDPTRPVELRLALAFGVCKDICIPAWADLALRLDERSERDVSIDDALARIPKTLPLGDGGPLAVLAVEPAGDGKTLAIAVRVPLNESPQLFLEAPDGWFVMARDCPKPPRAGGPAGATATCVAEIMERPYATEGPIELRLTLASASQAVETVVKLDTSRPSR
jgi:DsbC/DsbD-like thiol-disulfide interchange protein